ncbi:MAG: hypothetical protein QXX55_01020 [Candidatus Pacearchaeota archaeon]
MNEKETINFLEWQKMDLRVGKIIGIEDIPGADKIYKLTIDLGKNLGKRTLVAGLKKYYTPEKLKDKICIVFTNLEPKNFKGILSQGMLLAAVSSDEEHVHLLKPDTDDIELGSKIR